MGVVDPTKWKQNLRVFWKLMNLRECVWGTLNHIIMKTYCRKRWEFITAPQFGSQIYSYTSSYEISGSESSGGQGMGKNWRKIRRGTWQKSKVRNRWSMKQGRRGAAVHFASINGHMSSEKCWIGGKAPNMQRSSCSPLWFCKRQFRFLCSIHWTWIYSISNDNC